MSFKFDSMMLILNKIDSGEKVSVQSLKEDLGVSERTVHRYLETLQLGGYPLYFDRPRERYSFPEGYSMKRPGFTSGEALAFALAKKLTEGFGPDFRERLDTIEKKIAARPPADLPKIFVPEAGSPKGSAFLEILNQAALRFQRVDLTYRALSSGKKTRRLAEPDYLFYQEGLWYLRAYCCLREEFRTFALDRITSLRTLAEYFVPRNHSGEEELALSFGSFLDGSPVEVVLRFDPEIGDYIQRRKWHSSQEEETLPDGRLEAHFRVKGLEGIRRWVYRWLPQVEVIAPSELREKMIGDLEKALRKHGASRHRALGTGRQAQ